MAGQDNFFLATFTAQVPCFDAEVFGADRNKMTGGDGSRGGVS